MNVASFPLAQLVAVPTSHWDGGLAVDLFAPDGTPVLAVFDGYADSYWVSSGGNAITLIAPDGSAAYYAHLAAPGAGGQVRAGQVIGYEGRTGNADKGNGSSDSHLHFALASNAGVFEAAGGNGDIAPWVALAGLNGAPGAIDPGGGVGVGEAGSLRPLVYLGAALVVLFVLTGD